TSQVVERYVPAYGGRGALLAQSARIAEQLEAPKSHARDHQKHGLCSERRRDDPGFSGKHRAQSLPQPPAGDIPCPQVEQYPTAKANKNKPLQDHPDMLCTLSPS